MTILKDLDDVKETIEQAKRHYEKGNYVKSRSILEKGQRQLNDVDRKIVSIRLGVAAAKNIDQILNE